MTVLGREDAPPTPRELLSALRYPDRSVVIDLSRLSQDEKLHYVRAVLPALNVLRRRTGLPHRILLDEAHYYLHDNDTPQLLDFERNGYTVVTYCASRLPQALLAGTEVMIVTCESNPAEMEALRARCLGCADIDVSRWAILGHLKIGQAVALPLTEETGGELRLFTIAPRLTSHVRHRETMDVPVSSHRAFVFNANGQPGHRIRTLRQFVSELEHTPPALLAGYIMRGDFSRWIGDVLAITRSPASSERLKSDIEPVHAMRPSRKWPAPCGADMTLLRTNSRRRSVEIFRTTLENPALPRLAAAPPPSSRLPPTTMGSNRPEDGGEKTPTCCELFRISLCPIGRHAPFETSGQAL